jgi:hypothetical protein
MNIKKASDGKFKVEDPSIPYTGGYEGTYETFHDRLKTAQADLRAAELALRNAQDGLIDAQCELDFWQAVMAGIEQEKTNA